MINSNIYWELPKHGLIIIEYSNDVFYVNKPSALKGRRFSNFSSQVLGFGDVTLMVDSPFLEIKKTGIGKKIKYHLDMSLAYAPGVADEVWYRSIFKQPDEVVSAVLNLFFGSDTDKSEIISKTVEGFYKKAYFN